MCQAFSSPTVTNKSSQADWLVNHPGTPEDALSSLVRSWLKVLGNPLRKALFLSRLLSGRSSHLFPLALLVGGSRWCKCEFVVHLWQKKIWQKWQKPTVHLRSNSVTKALLASDRNKPFPFDSYSDILTVRSQEVYVEYGPRVELPQAIGFSRSVQQSRTWKTVSSSIIFLYVGFSCEYGYVPTAVRIKCIVDVHDNGCACQDMCMSMWCQCSCRKEGCKHQWICIDVLYANVSVCVCANEQ